MPIHLEILRLNREAIAIKAMVISASIRSKRFAARQANAKEDGLNIVGNKNEKDDDELGRKVVGRGRKAIIIERAGGSRRIKFQKCIKKH